MQKTKIFSKLSDENVKNFLALFFKKKIIKISKNFKILANKNAIKILRGVIFGIFSNVSNTRKLPGNYPDSALEIQIYPDPARDSTWTRFILDSFTL